MKRPLLIAALLSAVSLLAAACGGGGSDEASAESGPRRTVDIEMRDNSFSPAQLDVRRGETVTFAFHNTGKATHDAFVGDAKAQAGHEESMRNHPDDGHGHDDDETATDAVTVEPGRRASITHTFDTAGTYEIGCHQPGHYAAGMKAVITVA